MNFKQSAVPQETWEKMTPEERKKKKDEEWNNMTEEQKRKKEENRKRDAEEKALNAWKKAQGLPTGKKYREELRRKRKREQEKAELQQTEHKTKRDNNYNPGPVPFPGPGPVRFPGPGPVPFPGPGPSRPGFMPGPPGNFRGPNRFNGGYNMDIDEELARVKLTKNEIKQHILNMENEVIALEAREAALLKSKQQKEQRYHNSK